VSAELIFDFQFRQVPQKNCKIGSESVWFGFYKKCDLVRTSEFLIVRQRTDDVIIFHIFCIRIFKVLSFLLILPMCQLHIKCTMLYMYDVYSVEYYKIQGLVLLPSMLWHCRLGVRKSIQPVKNWVMRCWRGYLSGATANDLHMVQLMPMPPHLLLLH